ncbi:MAG: ADP-ribosylglycohydrolase family protein, partial [Candidatus Ratteibacteria bacterium]
MARHFGETWKNKLNRDHFYPLCMGNAYNLIMSGWDPRITGHWNVVTGSTVMCMEPVGMYHIGDSEYAKIDARAISYMYQRGLDVVAAEILVAAVSEALTLDATVDSVCNIALKAAPDEELKTFDRRDVKSCREYLEKCLDIASRYTDVLSVRKEIREKCLFYHPIDPLELLGIALGMFYIAKGDVRQAAIGGTNIGRDSDTIAGRAAMLSGALSGAGSIPQEWINLFKPEVLEKIRKNSELFVENAVNGRFKRLNNRMKLL